MGFLDIETSTFLVREKGLDAEPFLIIAACLFRRGHITDLVLRFINSAMVFGLDGLLE